MHENALGQFNLNTSLRAASGLFKMLGAVASQHPVVVVTNHFQCEAEHTQQLVAAFSSGLKRDFKVPAVAVGHAATFALARHNLRNGVVVDIGLGSFAQAHSILFSRRVCMR